MYWKGVAAAVVVTGCLFGSQPAGSADFSYGQRLFAIGKYEDALRVWRPMAEAGDVRAQYSIAVLYAQGLGVERNAAEARAWAERAAAQGHAPSLDLLARIGATAAEQSTPGEGRPEPAPADDAAGIAGLVRELLQEFIANRQGSLQHGPINVARAGRSYRVDVPDLSVRGAEGGLVTFGSLQLVVRPRDDLNYDVTAQLPTEIRIRDGAGAQVSVAIGRQDISILWDHVLKSSTDFAIRLSDLKMTTEARSGSLTVGDLAAVSEIRQNDDRWSGPLRFELSDIRLAGEDGFVGRIGRVAAGLQVDRLDLPLYLRAAQGLQAVVDSGREQALEPFSRVLDGMALDVSIVDVDVADAASGRLKLDEAEVIVGIRRAQEDLADISVKFGYAGLEPPAGLAGAQRQPRNLAADVVLYRLPARTVAYAALTLGIEAALFGDTSGSADLLPRLREDLAAAATSLAINRLALDGDGYDASLKGALDADGKAVFGFVGTLHATIIGASALLRQDQAEPADDFLLAFMQQAKTLGAVSGEAGDTLRYRVELDAGGRLLINGQEMVPAAAQGGPGRQ